MHVRVGGVPTGRKIPVWSYFYYPCMQRRYLVAGCFWTWVAICLIWSILLVGPIENPTGRAFLSINDQKVEDNVRGFWDHTLIDPDSGACRRIGGSCVFNFTSGGPRRDELEIVGTLGSLTISCFDAQPAQLKLDGGETIIVQHGDHPDTVQEPMIQLVTQDILARIKGAERDNTSTNASSRAADEAQLDPNVFLCRGESAVRTSVAMDRLLGRESWCDDYIIR